MLLVICVAASFWPGVAMYDTVAQYSQVLNNQVDDWHPPVMVRLWQALHLFGGTTGPMFVLQAALYGSGFALIVAALTSARRPRAALGAALLGLSPLLLGWQMVVLKDAQMLGALVAAFAIAAHYRLRDEKIPLFALAGFLLLIAFATLVRANALFATIPLALLTLAPIQRLVGRGAIGVVAILVVLALFPVINQKLLGASPSGIAKSQPLFDLAAIAVATGDSAPFTKIERDQLAGRHCVKNFFWDPIRDPGACGPFTNRVNDETQGQLYLELARSAAAHPTAYVLHRARHWNSTERWLVEPDLPDIAPPIEAEPNDLGLATPESSFAAAWQDLAGVEAATPIGWPIVWTIIALLLFPAAWRLRHERSGGLALALLVSALSLEASFLVISIASDLRYHLWPMTASALALILLCDDFSRNRARWSAGMAAVVLVSTLGIYSRLSMPPAPDNYQGMLHAASG